ncbi:MAG: PAS domain-containing sensor histidine kinase [Bacteriovoracia bacterium]
MDVLSQTALLVGVASFGFAASTLARNYRNKLYLAFAVFCIVTSIWAMSFFLDKTVEGGGLFYRVHLVCNVWLTPVALAFIRVMVRIQHPLVRRLFDISLFLAIALTIALVLGLDDFPGVRFIVLFSPALIAAQTVYLMLADRRVRQGIRQFPKVANPATGQGRRTLIYVGALFALGTSSMDHVPFLGPIIPALGNIALTVYLFFLSQAISQQRLLNFSALLTRFLVLIAVALVLTAIYSLLFAWIQDRPALFFLNSFIVSFLLLMLLEPLRAAVAYFTRQLLPQEQQWLETKMLEAQRELTGVVDLRALVDAAARFLATTLEPRVSAFYVLGSEGTKYRQVSRVRRPHVLSGGEGRDEEDRQGNPIRELLLDHPLLQHCLFLQSRGELPVLLGQVFENEMERSASRTQRANLKNLLQGLRALEANLLIPLVANRKILGFVALDAPTPPATWGTNWGLLQIIYPYFEQVARTLGNLEIYVRQREKERLAALGEMAAGLAHEIRNPLGAIKGAAQFLDPNAGGPDSRFLKVIVEETDRLNHVVTQFLDYSRPNAVEFQQIDLAELARKTCERMQAVHPEVAIDFRALNREAFVAGAPVQIQQVAINLLENAVKALSVRKDGKIWVSVRLEGEASTRRVILSVEDNGPGIKREHLEKLFIPFFTTSPSGTGLGLSICQKIVEAHSGRIEVMSEEGQYARFVVTFPVWEPAA